MCSCVKAAPKYYDSNSQRCIPAKFETRVSLNALTTSGKCAIKIKPLLAAQYELATNYAGSVVDTWGTAVAAEGYDATHFASYRVTSLCASYIATTAPTDSGGIITVAVSGPEAAAGGTANDWDSASTLAPEVEFFRQYQCNVCVCGSPEGVEPRVHQLIGSTDPHGFPFIYIGVRGGSSTSAIQFGEVVITMGVELHVNTDQFTTLLLQEPGQNIPQLEAAIDHAHRLAPSIIDQSGDPGKGKKTIWDAAEQAAVSLVEGLAPMALSSLMALL
jgi:hypothetical protein